jgi:hypothetical protein
MNAARREKFIPAIVLYVRTLSPDPSAFTVKNAARVLFLLPPFICSILFGNILCDVAPVYAGLFLFPGGVSGG